MGAGNMLFRVPSLPRPFLSTCMALRHPEGSVPRVSPLNLATFTHILQARRRGRCPAHSCCLPAPPCPGARGALLWRSPATPPSSWTSATPSTPRWPRSCACRRVGAAPSWRARCMRWLMGRSLEPWWLGRWPGCLPRPTTQSGAAPGRLKRAALCLHRFIALSLPRPCASIAPGSR